PHPPFGDLLRGQLADLSIAEYRRRLAQQVAELLDRDRLDVVLGEVGLDELGEREPPCDPPFSPKPLELALERLTSVLLSGPTVALERQIACRRSGRSYHSGQAVTARDMVVGSDTLCHQAAPLVGGGHAMPKEIKGHASRKAPEPSASHSDI